jgi:hypothetical protein
MIARSRARDDALRATSGNTADTAWAVLPPARAPGTDPRSTLSGDEYVHTCARDKDIVALGSRARSAHYSGITGEIGSSANAA